MQRMTKKEIPRRISNARRRLGKHRLGKPKARWIDDVVKDAIGGLMHGIDRNVGIMSEAETHTGLQ